MTSPKPAIFISYRRDDEPFAALLLYRELELAFGEANVFLDVNLQNGTEFPAKIESALAAATVVISVIGMKWSGDPKDGDPEAPPRIHDPTDWVHREIATALRERKELLPILVGRDEMPKEVSLPEALKPLSVKTARKIAVPTWGEKDRQPLLTQIATLTGLEIRELRSTPSADIQTEFLERCRRDHATLLGMFSESEVADLYVDPELHGALAEMGGEPVISLAAILARAVEGKVTKRWIVYGEPGSGKSTLLRNYCLELANSGGPRGFPLFVSLPALVRAKGSGWQRVASLFESTDKRVDALAELFARHASAGRIRVFLDGFDEVATESQSQAIRVISEFDELIGAGTLVVASRSIGRGELETTSRLKSFGRMRLQPFDEKKQQRLLEKWLKEGWWATWQRIRGSSTLRRLAPNALLLSLMARLAKHRKHIPDRIEDLHDAIVLDILEVGYKEGHARSSSRIGETQLGLDAMTEIALALHRIPNSDALWTKRQVIQVIEAIDGKLRERLKSCPELAGTERFLESIERTGLFSELGGEGTGYRFLHRTLGESLASRALDAITHSPRGESKVKSLLDGLKGQESRWGEIVALFVARADDPTKAERRLERIHEINAEIARRALPSVDSVSESLAQRILQLPGDDVDARCRLYRQLPELVGGPAGASRVLGKLARTVTDTYELWTITSELLHHSMSDDLEVAQFATDALDPENLFHQFGSPIDLNKLYVPGHGNEPYWVGIEACPGTPDLRIAAVAITNSVWSRFKKGIDPEAASRKPDAPVTGVSWYDAVMLCRWLGPDVHLPTEAMWEHACRAGSERAYCFGDDEAKLKEYAWYEKNSKSRVHAVATRKPNDWGLFDMHGNVWEWCEDQIGSSLRVVRGGSWSTPAWRCRSSYRDGWPPVIRFATLGFRPARFVTDPLYSFTSAAADGDETKRSVPVETPKSKKKR